VALVSKLAVEEELSFGSSSLEISSSEESCSLDLFCDIDLFILSLSTRAASASLKISSADFFFFSFIRYPPSLYKPQSKHRLLG
jgi:hypothetical protein